MASSIPPLLSNLKLRDQRHTTATTATTGTTLEAALTTSNPFNFSAACSHLPLAANTTGSDLFASHQGTPLVAIYFGAQWCPPCRSFSPQLSAFAKENATHISVIFCSADHSVEKAQQFAKGKFFYMVPFQDTARTALLRHFNIKSFPTLIVLDTRTDLKVVTRWGRLAIQSESAPGALVERWLSKKGGLFPKEYFYYVGVLLLMVVLVTFYKF